MKLLAIRDFLNNCNLEIPGAISKRFVHAGAQFEIGPGKEFEALSPNEQQLVGQLNLACCVTAPTPANIAKVEAFVKERKGAAAKTQ